MVPTLLVLSVLAQVSESKVSDFQTGMLKTNNAIRSKSGLFPHQLDPILCQTAMEYAQLMAKNRQTGHDVGGLSARQRAKNNGFPVDISRGDNLSVKEIGTLTIVGWPFNPWENWMKSTVGHGKVILSNHTVCGFGAAQNGDVVYWVALYGK